MSTAQSCKELEVCEKLISMCIELNWEKELEAGIKVRARIRESIIDNAVERTPRRFNV